MRTMQPPEYDSFNRGFRARAAIVMSVALIIASVLAACAPGSGERSRTVDEIIDSDAPRFRGIVEEHYDNAILVRVHEDEDIRKSSDLISVSLIDANPDANSGYAIGDEVCVYYDGLVAESYPAQVSAYAVLIEKQAATGIIPDSINVPDAVLITAVDWVKGDYEGWRDIGLTGKREYGAKFDNWRIDYIEHAYSYYNMNIEVYRFQWRVHTTTPDIARVTLVGGQDLDAEGWLLDTYPNAWYLFFEYRDGELFHLFTLMENDCDPGDKTFTTDMLNRLNETDAANRTAALTTARAYIDALADGRDLAGNEDGLAVFDRLFDRQQLYISYVRAVSVISGAYECGIAYDAPLGTLEIPLFIIFEDGAEPRFYCPYAYYGARADITLETYLDYLCGDDVAGFARWLSADGDGSESAGVESVGVARRHLDFYSQYDLSSVDVRSFGFDSETWQFVYILLTADGYAIEIRLDCGGGLVVPAALPDAEANPVDPEGWPQIDESRILLEFYSDAISDDILTTRTG